ncbi:MULTISPECIES: hypothetical protein [Acidiphilium]|uniref:Uncharacterized protein n=1 Tax=Acidiphilium rubrum TaxID=526 RepID=A0A8G2CK80_ACIRU|nr:MULTISPECIES: hypothetical protein [Acidiphilium]SIQ70634.1 hypothetical protein SAMN05421828_10860 [Acidiphilium rubrum]
MTGTISTTVTSAITLGSGGYIGLISITGTGAISVAGLGTTALYDPSSQTAALITNAGSILAGTGTLGSAGLLGLGGTPGGLGGDGVDLRGIGAVVVTKVV